MGVGKIGIFDIAKILLSDLACRQRPGGEQENSR
jgi:hypothetical protein